ncbi:ribonucleoside triphosphate reductase [Butyrivibrio sp. MC2013]|uniref:ribonucleoside triphosphate reductase n=1 Tax=Butyrivibrio sp. MC2013 TaxID=1280686 RepID=UPI000408C8CA|nr:ribonucleoside triphosphate reductase [Butyrivibrio sp. MC2013]
MINTIIKRDGTEQKFDEEKITSAMSKALDAVKEDYSEKDLKTLTGNAVVDLYVNYADKDQRVSVEQAQDAAEAALMKNGYYTAARAFILYRQNHKIIRGISKEVKNFAVGMVDGSLGAASEEDNEDPCQAMDIIKNQNASTAGGTMGAAILAESEAITKMWWENIYDGEIRSLCQVDGGCGEIYIHDMGMAAGYCAGWSLKDLLLNGLGGVANKIASAPASHLSTAVMQLVNFLGIMQNEWAGAQAVSSFDTYLAPFVKVDNMSYEEVKQCMQSFVFGANVSSRWGSQCPFSNITLDWTVPEDMAMQHAIVGGKEQDFTYGDCKKEMDMINKAFLEVMIAGDANGRGFQYPIPTYSITRDFDWSDTENNRLLFEMAAKYGTPYFSNYINSDMKPSDVRSMCCRLRLDLRELRKQNGGNFGAGENTGSIGVVTINLPHIAYVSADEDAFFKELEYAMNIAARSLDIKRRVVTQYLNKGAYPYTRVYLKAGFKNHFSTIGLVGMNETCLNAAWIREDLTHDKALKWAGKVLDFMRNKLSDYQEEYGCLFNLEATPAESTCYTLARMDRKNYPDIITAGVSGETPYYTNSSHLPVGSVDDIFDALDKEDDLQTKYTSGTVFHTFLGERLPDWKQAAKVVRTIAENYKLPYFTLSPTYSICEDHGYIVGEATECPVCGKKVEIYSRITGYYRPVSNWNAGKSQEFEDRRTYNMKVMLSKSEAEAMNTAQTNKSQDESHAETEKAVAGENFVASANAPFVSERLSIMLLTTSECPKCRMAKTALDKKGIDYTVLTAEEGTGRDMAMKYGIMSAPAIVVASGDEEKVIKDFGEVLRFIDQAS